MATQHPHTLTREEAINREIDEALGLLDGDDLPPSTHAPVYSPATSANYGCEPYVASPIHCSGSELSSHIHAAPSPYSTSSPPHGRYSPVASPTHHSAESNSPADRGHSSPPSAPGSKRQRRVQTPAAEPSAQAPPSLQNLPREVQMRMLYFLSAEDLTSIAQTCQCFRVLAEEPVLWRRLYCARWGTKHAPRGNSSWKVR
jgi:hypothetical protein